MLIKGRENMSMAWVSAETIMLGQLVEEQENMCGRKRERVNPVSVCGDP